MDIIDFGVVLVGDDVMNVLVHLNLVEQDHRGIKSRYGPMKGFKSQDHNR